MFRGIDMGWKTLKDHFSINHIVTSGSRSIYIGSPCVNDLVVINKETGRVVNNSTFLSLTMKEYPQLYEASPEDILQLINTQDDFEQSLIVYTYQGGEIIEKKCEQYGYPNVTHDGQLMYENTFSADKSQVIEWAIQTAEAGVRHFNQTLDRLKNDMNEVEASLIVEKDNLKKLKALSQ